MMTSNANRPCRCDNCSWEGPEEQLGRSLFQIHHLAERLDPGGTVPVGECPECGALAYLVETPATGVFVLMPCEPGDEMLSAGRARHGSALRVQYSGLVEYSRSHSPDLLARLNVVRASLRELADSAGDVPEWNAGGHAYVAAHTLREVIGLLEGKPVESTAARAAERRHG